MYSKLGLINLIPVEILCDIMKFLDRNALEKCQLVSHHWNIIIAQNAFQLPLRLLGELSILHYFENSDFRTYFYTQEPSEGQSVKLDEITLPLIRTSVFYKFSININENFNKLIEKLDEISASERFQVPTSASELFRVLTSSCERFRVPLSSSDCFRALSSAYEFFQAPPGLPSA
uniref:F-box domain-containing protein n=1 Tax=Acrobeloides nanus TaxID=290746 RepID=A0A914DIS7_9BILA